MKARWEVKPLGEIAKTTAGGTPKKSNKTFYEGGTIPWLVSGEVANPNITESKNFITKAGLAGSSAKIYPKNSVLIAMYGATAGEVGILRFQACSNQAVCAVLPNPNYLPEYLYYCLLNLQSNLAGQAIGNAQPNISQAKIKALEIPIPPLKEQKRIVAVLDAAFDGLTRAKENAEANLQNARELFEAGLVSVFSAIENESDQKLLKEIALDFGRGKSKHRPRNAPFLYDGPYPFVQTGDVRNSEHLITEYKQTYTDAGLAQSKLWPANTLCITIAANIAETAILSFDACFPDSIIGVVPDPKLTSSRYLEYLLQFFQKRLKARGEGAAQHNINLATFETEYFPFPSLSRQDEAIDALDNVSSAVQLAEAHYRTKLNDIADLRQSLLQKAFAGELT